MIVEIPEQWTRIYDYLLENERERQYPWSELVYRLDERARRKVADS